MVKQPIEVHDRFKISFEVEVDKFGEVVADLTKLGVTNIQHELITDVIRFKSNRQHEMKAEDFLAAWIAENPTFKANEAVVHFREAGRTDGSCYTALRILSDKGALKKLSAGNYARADVKAIEAGTHTKAAAQAASTTRRYEVSNADFITKFAKKHHGKFTTTQLKEVFVADGRNAGSVSPTCNDMLEQKLIKRVDKGAYVLTAKASGKPAEAQAKPKMSAAPPPPKANGNGLHVESLAGEAMSHG